MMVSPVTGPARYHRIYHQSVGIWWYRANPTGMLIPQKTAENSHLWHQMPRLGMAFW
jgi:hypothetical protein